MNIVSRWCVALMAGVAACGGGGGDGGTQPPPPAVFTSLVVSPASPNMVDGDTVQLTATPRDQNGGAMTGLPAATFQLLTGTAVSVSGSGQVIAQQAGAATIRASVTSGATTKEATANATVTALAPTATVAATTGNAFNPDTVKIATNGQVTWNFGTTAHNVTFQSPPAPVANLATQSSSSEARVFATNGRYPYLCTIHAGMDGVVVVRSP